VKKRKDWVNLLLGDRVGQRKQMIPWGLCGKGEEKPGKTKRSWEASQAPYHLFEKIQYGVRSYLYVQEALVLLACVFYCLYCMIRGLWDFKDLLFKEGVLLRSRRVLRGKIVALEGGFKGG